MNDTVTLPAPVVAMPPPLLSKWQREYAAFQRLLPRLLESHRGRFVAIHDEQVVDHGDDKLALAMRVLARIGNIDIHVGLVTDAAIPTARSGVRREVRTPGGDA